MTLGPDHCEAAGILPMEFVDIWNKNSGARISTYVIYGERGSRCCILNGAAARTCQRGDEVITCNSVYVTERELEEITPAIPIGRASCTGRVCQYVENSGVEGTLIK